MTKHYLASKKIFFVNCMSLKIYFPMHLPPQRGIKSTLISCEPKWFVSVFSLRTRLLYDMLIAVFLFHWCTRSFCDGCWWWWVAIALVFPWVLLLLQPGWTDQFALRVAFGCVEIKCAGVDGEICFGPQLFGLVWVNALVASPFCGVSSSSWWLHLAPLQMICGEVFPRGNPAAVCVLHNEMRLVFNVLVETIN